MTMMVNGNSGAVLAGLVYVQPVDPTADLEAWGDAIAHLNAALADAASARSEIEAVSRTLERIEASTMLSVEGSNAEVRKARLTLALADDARFEAHSELLTRARERQLDAERRIAISRERCRLLRTRLSLLEQRDAA